MKTKLAILAMAVFASPVMAQHMQQSSPDELLKAAKSNTQGDTNNYPVDVSYKTGDTGETLTIYTVSGPGEEFESVVSHCLIKMEETVGFDHDAGLIRAMSLDVPVCGDQYSNPFVASQQAIVEASFAITEIIAY